MPRKEVNAATIHKYTGVSRAKQKARFPDTNRHASDSWPAFGVRARDNNPKTGFNTAPNKVSTVKREAQRALSVNRGSGHEHRAKCKC